MLVPINHLATLNCSCWAITNIYVSVTHLLQGMWAGYLCTSFRDKKGKAVPLQAWSGPEGSRKLRFPDFVTTAQDSGKVVILTHRLPLPQEIFLVLISVGG